MEKLCRRFSPQWKRQTFYDNRECRVAISNRYEMIYYMMLNNMHKIRIWHSEFLAVCSNNHNMPSTRPRPHVCHFIHSIVLVGLENHAVFWHMHNVPGSKLIDPYTGNTKNTKQNKSYSHSYSEQIIPFLISVPSSIFMSTRIQKTAMCLSSLYGYVMMEYIHRLRKRPYLANVCLDTSWRCTT